VKLFRKTPQDLKTALGQCFWIGLNGSTANDPATKEIFKRFQPGGVILFQRNTESISQIQKLNADLQEQSSIPLFLAIDQEGGIVERLHQIIGTIPPAMALAATHNSRLIRRIHTAHARILRALGFNVNFTPVLDLALTGQDNGLGTRCFSDDPRIVFRCAREVIRAHSKAGILTCGKHFPGLGDTDRDSHVFLPSVARSWKQVEREDLLPYRKLLDQLPFIMINHALYPDKNKKLPASLSKEIVNDFLIQKWNYPGLSISDDLIMGAVSKLYNLTEAAERALLAGNHLFLICRPEGVLKTFDRLLSRASRTPEFASAVFRASSRILAFKIHSRTGTDHEIKIKDEIHVMRKLTQEISGKAITHIHGESIGKIPSQCTLFLPLTKWLKENSNVQSYLSKRGCQVSSHFYQLALSEPEARLLASQSNTQFDIVVTTNSLQNPGQAALLDELAARGKQLCVISGAYPGGRLPDDVRIAMASYWTFPAALEAAVKAILGERKAPGKLPLRKPGIVR